MYLRPSSSCLRLSLLPLRRLQLLGGDIAGKDRDSTGLGIDLGEALNDQGVFGIAHRRCHILPLLRANVDDISGCDCLRRWDSFWQCWYFLASMLHHAHDAGALIDEFAQLTNQGYLHSGGLSFLVAYGFNDGYPVFPDQWCYRGC